MREILQIHNEEEERDYGRLYRPDKDVKVIKKDGSREDFNVGKVVNAIGKSAYRALTDFSDEEIDRICRHVITRVNDLGEKEIPIPVMHSIVEDALELAEKEQAVETIAYLKKKKSKIERKLYQEPPLAK